MASIDLSNVVFYKGGTSGVSRVVGNDWENGAAVSRVARYMIQAPTEGASRLSLSFQSNKFGDGDYIGLRFFIGTSQTSHANAGKNSEYTGEFTLDKTYPKFTAEVDFLMLPGETYFLWLFPASANYGWYYWDNEDISLVNAEGAAGVARIDSGAAIGIYQANIDSTGDGYHRYAPYIDTGSGWEVAN